MPSLPRVGTGPWIPDSPLQRGRGARLCPQARGFLSRRPQSTKGRRVLGHQRPREAHCIELSVNEPEACGLHFPQLPLPWEGFWARAGRTGGAQTDGGALRPLAPVGSLGWGIKKPREVDPALTHPLGPLGLPGGQHESFSRPSALGAQAGLRDPLTQSFPPLSERSGQHPCPALRGHGGRRRNPRCSPHWRAGAEMPGQCHFPGSSGGPRRW